MHGLHVGIAVVLVVAGAVVGQGFALMQGLKGPADVGAWGLAGGRRVGGFVDVIAQVQQKMQVVAGRQGSVGVEEAGVELATGGLGEAQMADARPWQGAGAPSGGGLTLGLEAVVVEGVGGQARGSTCTVWSALAWASACPWATRAVKAGSVATS